MTGEVLSGGIHREGTGGATLDREKTVVGYPKKKHKQGKMSGFIPKISPVQKSYQF